MKQIFIIIIENYSEIEKLLPIQLSYYLKLYKTVKFIGYYIKALKREFITTTQVLKMV